MHQLLFPIINTASHGNKMLRVSQVCYIASEKPLVNLLLVSYAEQTQKESEKGVL